MGVLFQSVFILFFLKLFFKVIYLFACLLVFAVVFSRSFCFGWCVQTVALGLTDGWLIRTSSKFYLNAFLLLFEVFFLVVLSLFVQ